MNPPSKNRALSAKRKQQIPSVTTFQIDAYETRRIKCFPPRAVPKPRVIRFSARNACQHPPEGHCKGCREGKGRDLSALTSEKGKAIDDKKSSVLPQLTLDIDELFTDGLPYHALSWWPSLSNSNCTEPMSARGVWVSRNLFQAILNDQMSSAAFSALIYACELVTTPSFDHAENKRYILNQKQHIFSLLRTRLAKRQPVSGEVIMTIFFLLTLDLLDGAGHLAHTWDIHLGAMAKLVATSGEDSKVAFRPHLKSRNETYLEYLKWIKTGTASSSASNSEVHLKRRNYLQHPLPDWLINQMTMMPVGFAELVRTTLLGLDTIDLIQQSCELSTLFASQSSNNKSDGNDATHLTQLIKETNFRCNDLLILHNKLNRVEEILIIGLASHCQHLTQEMPLRFGTPNVGLGISTLLSTLCCTSLAREYELIDGSMLASPAVRNAMLWAGSMLVATSAEDCPAMALGRRLLRLCRETDRANNPKLVKTGFIWSDTLAQRSV